MLGFVTSLILALQWGGNQKPWHDKDVIATLVVAGVLLILFGSWEYYLGEEKAMVPLNLLKRRAQIGASFESVCVHLLMTPIPSKHNPSQFFIFLILMIGTYFSKSSLLLPPTSNENAQSHYGTKQKENQPPVPESTSSHSC